MDEVPRAPHEHPDMRIHGQGLSWLIPGSSQQKSGKDWQQEVAPGRLSTSRAGTASTRDSATVDGPQESCRASGCTQRVKPQPAV